METVEKLKKNLIEKIISIKNMELLYQLDQLISTNINDSETIKLNPDQKRLLEKSEEDIKNGDLISQEAMEKRNLEWLNEM